MEKNWRVTCNFPSFLHSCEIKSGQEKPGYEANCDRSFSVHVDYYINIPHWGTAGHGRFS